ncbi:MBOAT family O-acyltransferase [Tannockella kyphosi]|uniref:MBOAT family O-acyltransferase n=1 Tax=Tannockella kyphosi TaxID=2899121 RepID=UPI002012D5C1|nr:MBOAT family O-acyltransferase [Tannockella kyphosi]
MLFSSITFLYYFMPIMFGIYYLLPHKYKNCFLLVASLFFYGWQEPKYLFIMLFSIVNSYYFGLLIEKNKNIFYRKVVLVISCISSLGLLIYFKYIHFIVEQLILFFKLEIPLLQVALPVGISFFTFQTISYTIDVYRQDVKASKSLINYATYVSMFPQLIAGPIVRYENIEVLLKNRNIFISQIYDGVCRFLIGLAKKVIIANNLALLCQNVIVLDHSSVLMYWLYAIGFSLQIYFDFSGYSDMAIGLGKMLGFEFLENFKYPFVSSSITEFWRRWHISLGNWFRDYVYIPLGGNRHGIKKTLFHIVLVWALTGLWHGAAYQFILWGIMFAVLLIFEKLFLLEYLEKIPRWMGRIYTLFFVSISFVIFNASDIGQAFLYIKGMFSFGMIPFVNEVSLYYLSSYFYIIIIAMVGATPLVSSITVSITKRFKLYWLEPLVLFMLLIGCTAYLVDSSFNPFLYFRF